MFGSIVDAIGNVVTAVVNVFTGGGSPPPSNDPCDQGACGTARRELAAARRNTLTACGWVTLIFAPLRVALWILNRDTRFYILSLIVLILIFGIGGILIGLAIYGAAFLFIRAWLPLVNVAVRRLSDASERENTAIANVDRTCPQECKGNLEPSECDPLGEGNVLAGPPLGEFQVGAITIQRR